MPRIGHLLRLAAVALLLAAPWPAAAQESAAAEGSIGSERVQEIERIIENYLLEHPEVLVRAFQKLDQREKAAREARTAETIASRGDEIFNDPTAPFAGNPDGDVTVVEFFDYRCPYCKRVMSPMMKTIAADGRIRLVFKEFPILGADSYYAARAALAASRQDKYEPFHVALMSTKGELSEAIVMALAGKVGLDVERLQADMEDPEIGAAIDRNYDLADALGITGTPGFVIGSSIVRGAIDMNAFRRLVAKARAS